MLMKKHHKKSEYRNLKHNGKNLLNILYNQHKFTYFSINKNN